MKERTISATITLPAEQLAELLASRVVDRHAPWWRSTERHAPKSQAARIISCSPTTITAMLEDGRLKSACEGTRVDVRSLADYIENREKCITRPEWAGRDTSTTYRRQSWKAERSATGGREIQKAAAAGPWAVRGRDVLVMSLLWGLAMGGITAAALGVI